MWPSENATYTIKEISKQPNYNSKDGMQSAIFGPAFWMTIHLVSFNYPNEPTDEDKQNYATWLMSIGKVLPCKYCRLNFEKNMQSAGFNESCMQSRYAFSRFCYDLHCTVNKMLNKTSPSFEEVRSKYEMFRAKCLSDEEKQALAQENKELGCIRPKHNGSRGKCLISIVPQDGKTSNILIHEKCMPSQDS